MSSKPKRGRPPKQQWLAGVATGLLGQSRRWRLTQESSNGYHALVVEPVGSAASWDHARLHETAKKGGRTTYLSVEWDALPRQAQWDLGVKLDRTTTVPVHRLVLALAGEEDLRARSHGGVKQDAHHRDGNGLNNRLGNLVRLPEHVHDQLHRTWAQFCRGTATLDDLRALLEPVVGDEWERLARELPWEEDQEEEKEEEDGVEDAERISHPGHDANTGLPGGSEGDDRLDAQGESLPREALTLDGLPVVFEVPSALAVRRAATTSSASRVCLALEVVAPVLAEFGPEGAIGKVLEGKLVERHGHSLKWARELMSLAVVDESGLVTKTAETTRHGRQVRYRYHPEQLVPREKPQKPPGRPAAGGGDRGQAPPQARPAERPVARHTKGGRP